MKKFVCNLLLFVFVFVVINIALIMAFPIDRNIYLCEYNHKVKLLKDTSSPRIVFIGGSNLAFGMNSATLKDTLKHNIVNFGLHAGIGMRYPFEDYLDYMKTGDVVVLQFEYENFYNGGNGDSQTLFPLMRATNWRRCNNLNVAQWKNILIQIPETAINNLKRILRFSIIRPHRVSEASSSFIYAASGFNVYGDEVSHFNFPSQKFSENEKKNSDLSSDFLVWLAQTIKECESAGVHVIVLPPVCIESSLKNIDTDAISKALDEIGHPYAVEPSFMVLSDDYAFDTRYHMNKEGAIRNTQNIIQVLAPIIN